MLSSRTRRTRPLPDGADLARSLHVRPGVGIAAHVLQGQGLKILRMRVDQPALILVGRGIKAIRTERGASVTALPGQAVVLGGNQTVDFTNSVADGSHYEARWLLFDDALLADAHYLGTASQAEPPGKPPASVHLLRRVSANLADAFDRAGRALALGEELPAAVTRLRVLEVMQWLLEEGIVLRSSPADPGASIRVRALIAGRLDEAWPAGRVAGDMALSEATLRRRLAAEGTSLTDLPRPFPIRTHRLALRRTGPAVRVAALCPRAGLAAVATGAEGVASARLGAADPGRRAVAGRIGGHRRIPDRQARRWPLQARPAHPDFASFLYWFHLANGNLQPAMVRMIFLRRVNLPADNPVLVALQGRLARIFALVEARLGDAPWFAGSEFTAADIMSVVSLTTMRLFQPVDLAPFPNIRAYLQRIGERPAYRRAMAHADPDLTPMLD